MVYLSMMASITLMLVAAIAIIIMSVHTLESFLEEQTSSCTQQRILQPRVVAV